jgi:hypothetical protein
MHSYYVYKKVYMYYRKIATKRAEKVSKLIVSTRNQEYCKSCSHYELVFKVKNTSVLLLSAKYFSASQKW